MLGSSVEETILPSAFAFRQRYKREPPLHLVDAFQVETHGMLGLIVSYAVCRRKAADKERGKLVLRSFLSTVLDMEDPILDLDLLTAGEEVIAAAGQCEVNQGLSVSGGLCCDGRAVLRDALQETDALDAVSTLLLRSFRNRSTCCAAGPLFKSVVFKLVRHVASIAAVLGTGDALHGDTAVRGSSKRRLDTDRKSALIALALEDRKAKSVKVLCQGRKEKGAENSDRWLAEEASAYRWAAAATFAGVQNLSLAYDASRVGQPKEDTLVVAGLAVDTNTGAWFVPQASQCSFSLRSSDSGDMQHPINVVRVLRVCVTFASAEIGTPEECIASWRFRYKRARSAKAFPSDMYRKCLFSVHVSEMWFFNTCDFARCTGIFACPIKVVSLLFPLVPL